jgi:hypothetical protein
VKHVVQIEEMREMHTNFKSENLKEIDSIGTLGEDTSILLK